MIWPSRKPPLDELLDILRKEKESILSGNLEELTILNKLKEKHLMEIKSGRRAIAQRRIEEIRHIASENRNLLQAAKSGVKSIRQRLEELQRVADGTQTYSPDGTRATLGQKSPENKRSY